MSKPNFNRTKIVVTLGPAADSYKIINQLVLSGVDAVRLNFSHGTKQEHSEKIKIVRSISRRIGRPIPILADLPGPKLRVGRIFEPKELVKGEEIVLSARDARQEKEEIYVKYANLPNEVKSGNIIYLDDGAIKLKVKAKDKVNIICKVIVGGMLRSEAGINLPGITLKTGFLTHRDRDLISFSIKQGVDLLALSFVRKAEDINKVRNILKKRGKEIFLISKIEKHEALGDIDNIIKLSDGIMVARGDLGVELPLEKVALIQKSIIKKCNKSGKPVITATQMLESMIHNSRPTRAEVTDISNAILDGTDAVMLSGETAIGEYPLEAVKVIARIARHVESSLDYSKILSQRHRKPGGSITEVMGFLACESALGLKAKAIVAPTRSGRTARMISRYRPKAMIMAPTSSKSVLMQLCLSWGVYPVMLQGKQNFKFFVTDIVNMLKRIIPLRKHDIFIITGGSPENHGSHTNFVRVERVR